MPGSGVPGKPPYLLTSQCLIIANTKRCQVRKIKRSNSVSFKKAKIIKNKKDTSSIENINTTIIYFLIDKDEIVYIGKSDKYLERITHHSTNKKFDSYWTEKVDRKEASKIESNYIFEYAPKYNKAITSPSKTKIRLTKKTTNTKNKNFLVWATVLNNKLYIDLEFEDFDFLDNDPIVISNRKREEYRRQERREIKYEKLNKELLDFELKNIKIC